MELSSVPPLVPAFPSQQTFQIFPENIATISEDELPKLTLENCERFYSATKEADTMFKVFVGRTINKAVDSASRQHVGLILDKCMEVYGWQHSHLASIRWAGRVYSVLLEKMGAEIPKIQNLKWFNGFPKHFSTADISRFWDQVYSPTTKALPTLGDLNKHEKQFGKFFFVVFLTC
jgi:hypothetical protein